MPFFQCRTLAICVVFGDTCLLSSQKTSKGVFWGRVLGCDELGFRVNRLGLMLLSEGKSSLMASKVKLIYSNFV